VPSFAPFQALRASAGSRALTIMNRGCCIGNRGGLCVLLLLVMGGVFVSDCNRGFLMFCGVASLFGIDANQKDKLIRRMFFTVFSFLGRVLNRWMSGERLGGGFTYSVWLDFLFHQSLGGWLSLETMWLLVLAVRTSAVVTPPPTMTAPTPTQTTHP